MHFKYHHLYTYERNTLYLKKITARRFAVCVCAHFVDRYSFALLITARVTSLARGHHVDAMMTSWNGNIFRVTGHLGGELNGPRWIPSTKAGDAELWMFSLICVWINGRVNNREAGDLRHHRAHYDLIVMATLNKMALCSLRRQDIINNDMDYVE